jgi:hypothetical protein
VIFYHYTAIEYLESILRDGLNKGEIPITPRKEDCLNGVWLTTSKSASGHGLSDGEELSEELRRLTSAPKGAHWHDKRAVRITVKMPKEKLKHWPAYGKKRLEPWWYRAMSRTGGGEKVARTWYISLKPISPEQFEKVEVRNEDGAWIDYKQTSSTVS